MQVLKLNYTHKKHKKGNDKHGKIIIPQIQNYFVFEN